MNRWIVFLIMLLTGCALNRHDEVTADYHWHLVEDAAGYQISTIYWFALKKCVVRVIINETHELLFDADLKYCEMQP